MEEIFTKIYDSCLWGNNNDNEYDGSSGGGSTLEYNKNEYIPFLKNFLLKKNIKKVVDLGCGDFICGHSIYDSIPNIEYHGYDTYKKIIDKHNKSISSSKFTFTYLDFFKEKENIDNGDLCILKDVLQHWSLENITLFLDYLVESGKFKYILICNCSWQTEDNLNINNGEFRCLSSNYFPLKKYKPEILLNYNTKEVSLISLPIK